MKIKKEIGNFCIDLNIKEVKYIQVKYSEYCIHINIKVKNIFNDTKTYSKLKYIYLNQIYTEIN